MLIRSTKCILIYLITKYGILQLCIPELRRNARPKLAGWTIYGRVFRLQYRLSGSWLSMHSTSRHHWHQLTLSSMLSPSLHNPNGALHARGPKQASSFKLPLRPLWLYLAWPWSPRQTIRRCTSPRRHQNPFRLIILCREAYHSHFVFPCNDASTGWTNTCIFV